MASKLSVLLFCVVCIFGAEGFINKCKSDDDACIQTSAKAAYAHMVAGDNTLGVEPSDPIFVDKIEGNFANLKFLFSKTTLVGLGSCAVENVKLNLEASSLKADLICPSFDFQGDYAIDGVLITLPIEGNGKFSIKCKKYKLGVDANLNTVTGDDGESHMHIKNFKLNIDGQGGVVFDFQNLFNGDKELSDAVHKFANENWKIVSEEFQRPIFEENFKRLVKNINKFLKTTPKDIFL
ncbi:hypothetical protein ABMA28_002845 [Loxostege sticticalis]|uniref:Uncharacterized protein n=1 Tax=Loxostege sticticalis TaxID=481309 RepID=A0ABD0SZF4_LOXSC